MNIPFLTLPLQRGRALYIISFCITEGYQPQHIFARDAGMASNNLLYFGIHGISLSLVKRFIIQF